MTHHLERRNEVCSVEGLVVLEGLQSLKVLKVLEVLKVQEVLEGLDILESLEVLENQTINQSLFNLNFNGCHLFLGRHGDAASAYINQTPNLDSGLWQP